jgi:hypothetical protein
VWADGPFKLIETPEFHDKVNHFWKSDTSELTIQATGEVDGYRRAASKFPVIYWN